MCVIKVHKPFVMLIYMIVFDANRAFTVILYIQAYLDRGYFWALFQLPPTIIYENK